jgi:hypothetical protein
MSQDFKDQTTKISQESYSEPTIGMIGASKNFPSTVQLDAPLEEAITLMLLNDFSQLPIIQHKRKVQGMISWKSIGKRIGCKNQYVHDMMDDAESVEILFDDMPLVDAVRVIAGKDVALIRSRNNGEITGLVDTSDITDQFMMLAAPFFLIGAMENYIRHILERIPFDLVRKALCDNSTRDINDLNNLSFGDYIRVLKMPSNWESLKLRLSRKVFVSKLDTVRIIRNKIMHFRATQLPEEEIQLLRNFLNVLKSHTNSCD